MSPPAAGALRWELPGWAGSVDLLLITTPDGTEPSLSLLAEQAYRRGVSVAAVAPPNTPLAEAVAGAHGLFVPLATAPYEHDEPLAASAPGVLWALLTPLLALLDRVGLLTAPPDALQKVADRLDQVAERCGPAIATYGNPAKTLASELSDALPLIWTEGTSAARPTAGSPPRSPNCPAPRPSSPSCPRRSPRTAPCSPDGSPPAPTPTTSSATAWRSLPRCTRAWCCCGTVPSAASQPPPQPANSPSAMTRR
ncbi:hypothetical protein GCM10020256_47060 [Streptomyces thermocoprophilus]